MLREKSPYVDRIFSLWDTYREKIITFFPEPPGLNDLDALYCLDAYNSLSIEGYDVDQSLIEKVQNNHWNPENSDDRNLLAARGYYKAFIEVKKSLLNILQGQNPGEVFEKALQNWYQGLFFPRVQVGILRPIDLLGYRKGQVYIRNSLHVPLPRDALLDAMETLFDCLKKEKNAAVRAVLVGVQGK